MLHSNKLFNAQRNYIWLIQRGETTGKLMETVRTMNKNDI